MAADCRFLTFAVDDEIMPLGFKQHGFVKQPVKGFCLARTQGCAQINVVFLPKAHVKCAGAGHAHAVAAFAEIMGLSLIHI